MNSFGRRPRLAMMAATAMCLIVQPVAAQTPWPSRPVRLVVPFPPGGSTDLLARALGEKLSKSLGQAVVIDNKPGASGALAAESVVRADPDGYTVLVTIQAPVVVVPHYTTVRYDPLRDLVSVAALANGPLVFAGNAAFPARNVKEVVAYARAHPNTVSYASFSPGTWSHFAGLLLNRHEKIDLLHVGYKGSAPAIGDVVGGQVQLIFDGQATVLPMVKAGKLRAYAVTSATRTRLLPDVPTFAELGYPEISSDGWMGAFAPAKTPDAVVKRLNTEFVKLLNTPEVMERLNTLGAEPASAMDAARFGRQVASDYKRWGDIVRTSGYRPE